MRHAQAFSHESQTFERLDEAAEIRIRSCHTELLAKGSSFSQDVRWDIYHCPTCKVDVWTVHGSVHWWNHERETTHV